MQSIFETKFGNIDHHLEVLFKESQEDKGIQNVYTPLNKIETAANFKFNSILNNDIKKIGVLFNAEFIRYILKSFDENYLNNIELTYFYDSEYDRNDAVHIRTEYGYKKDIEMISIKEFNEKKDIEVIKKAMSNKHFDIIFSNPPYGTKNVKLDLNILQSVFPYAKKILFIHPSTFIFDKKFKWKQYNDLRNTNYIEKVITFWGNIIFNIGLFCPLCISVWNTEKHTDDIEVIDIAITKTSYKTKINDVCIHGNDPTFRSFYSQLENYVQQNGSILSNLNIYLGKQQTEYSVKFATIRGNAGNIDYWKDDFFSLICTNIKDNYCDSTFNKYNNWANSQKLIWSFNNEQERFNFINYCKTKFVRFCLSILKNTSSLFNGELALIPWIDFTQEWNDSKLCKEFNISKDLWEYINNFIPDYYNDYKSGF